MDFEVIGGLPSQWVVKIKRKGSQIVRWKPVASSNINFGEVYSYLNEHLHQSSINAPSITGTKEADHDTTSQIGLQQSPVEDDCAADDHYESAHDSDDRNEPEARTKFCNDYFAQWLNKIESSIHELRSELQAGHSSINELRSELQAEGIDAQQYREAVVGFMVSFGAGSSKGAYGDSLFGPSHTALDGYGPNVDAGYGTHTDAGNDDEHTCMSLYSLYGDISGDNVQIFTKAPPGVSKFGHPYRPSYIFGSPYFVPHFKRVRNVRPLPVLNITDYEIDERSSVDMNPLRGLEDSRLCEEFDQWFAGKIFVDRPVQQSLNFFEILMGNASMEWLGDEVFLKQLWNNGSCDVHSVQYGNNLNSYMDGREYIMSKLFTDVDMEWGFTKFSCADYLRWKSENRIVPDGVNAKLFGCHGPLADRQPGRAFLEATI
ncbi:hypothetical protein CUMW_262300 [Citrus unshiu]|uniref:Uncharacterized protein n=1 Tax=Citrus unshiu TaxID=55188 RepID=A0A2H5QUA1_CITUN|nr:hypothetical protein CUMW_262300 [Citrus unshiu]